MLPVPLRLSALRSLAPPGGGLDNEMRAVVLWAADHDAVLACRRLVALIGLRP
jgi:hypothetical protein